MKRIILTLVCSVAVFAATMVLTYKYEEREALEDADRLNALLVNRVSDYADRMLRLTETSALSYLTGLFYTRDNESDTIGYTGFYTTEHFKQELGATVYDVLDDFLRINSHASSAMFIFASDGGGGDGKNAPMMKRDDSERYDLSGSRELADFATFKAKHPQHHAIWCLPSSSSPLFGKSIVCYVPVNDEAGRFYAAFVATYDVNELQSRLISVLPYTGGKSGIFLVDNENAIVASTYDYDKSRYGNITEMQRAMTRAGVLHRVDSAEESASGARFIADIEGNRHYVYYQKLKHIPWRVVVVCSEEAVYAEVFHTANIVAVVSLIGMALMLICCIVIFRQMRNSLRHRVAMESELRLAAQMQLSMLRPDRATLTHFDLAAYLKPAKETGGDFYDYVVRGNELLFAVGDVSGKGVSAALFMTQVCSLFRSAVGRHDAPDDIVREINDVLARHNPQMTFCTMYVGIYDSVSHSLRYCNAGHTRPLAVVRGEVTMVDVLPNMAVGVMEGYDYKSQSMTLQQGDSLIVYTDGVTEAMDGRHRLFGEQRLVDAIDVGRSADEIVADITDAVQRHTHGAPQSDDITILSIAIH